MVASVPMTPISSAEKDTVLAQLKRMKRNGVVMNSLCQRLISRSAYWYGHPHGPAKAPKHADRVTGGLIEFGANSLDVAMTVRLMMHKINEILDSNVKTKKGDLLPSFEVCLSLSVKNHRGDEYYDYPIQDGYMHFGSQAIHAGEFSREFFDLEKCHLITL